MGPKVVRKMERCMGYVKLCFSESSAGYDVAAVWQYGRNGGFADNIDNIACPGGA
jgi:hypothetical protein